MSVQTLLRPDEQPAFSAGAFVAQLLLSTVVATAFSALLSLSASAIVGSSAERFLITGTVPILPIVVGFALGMVVQKGFGGPEGRWVGVAAASIFILSICFEVMNPTIRPYWRQEFFSPLGRLMSFAPTCASVAYSLAAFLIARRHRTSKVCQ